MSVTIPRDPAVWLLAFAETIIWAGLYYVFPALLVHWEADLGWSRADLTGAITLAIFVSAAASPITGKFIDQGHGPQVMTMAVIIGCLCLYLLGAVTTRPAFYLLWAIIGACFGAALYDPCFALITRCRGDNAKKAIIMITLIAGFASTISFPVAHYLAENFGWRATVRLFAGGVILIGAPALWHGARRLEQHKTTSPYPTAQPGPTTGSLYRSATFWLLATGFACGALVHSVTLQHLIPILFDRGIPATAAITAASFIGPMQVAGRIAMAAAQRHISHHGVAIACFLIMAASMSALFLSAHSVALVPLFVILFGGGYGIVSIIRPVIAKDILGEHHFGAKFGALSMVYLIGAASAPFIGALVWGSGGYNLLLPGLILLALIGLGLYVMAWTTAGSGKHT